MVEALPEVLREHRASESDRPVARGEPARRVAPLDAHVCVLRDRCRHQTLHRERRRQRCAYVSVAQMCNAMLRIVLQRTALCLLPTVPTVAALLPGNELETDESIVDAHHRNTLLGSYSELQYSIRATN